MNDSPTFASVGRDVFEALCYAAVTGWIAAHFQLPLATWGLLIACTVAVGTARLVIGYFRVRASARPEETTPEHSLRQVESSTTVGGVALVAAIACLATDPPKGADPGIQSAVVVAVVASAFCLLSCRLCAQDDLRTLARHQGPVRDFPVRTRARWALLSLASIAFTGGLLVIAVW